MEARDGIEPIVIGQLCRPPPAPARTAPKCSQQDSNLRSLPSEGSVLSAWTMRARVRRDGLEPSCGVPDLQSGAVAAVPPTLRRWALEYPQHEPNVPVQVVVLVLGR